MELYQIRGFIAAVFWGNLQIFLTLINADLHRFLVFNMGFVGYNRDSSIQGIKKNGEEGKGQAIFTTKKRRDTKGKNRLKNTNKKSSWFFVPSW